MTNNQQIHKRLSNEQVVLILEHYLSKEVDLAYALNYLGVKRSRFFDYLKTYRERSDKFTINYQRKKKTRGIDQKLEKIILQELEKEKELIQNESISIKSYNYSSVRDDIIDKYKLKVSVPTIIDRAKNNGFYLDKPSREIHDREVITNFIGELIQHDSSHHLWSPFMNEKLYLITSIDDYSRFLLFADLFERETSWHHICAAESVILNYGCPLKYYPDQHSIFRFVKDRDKFTPWHTYTKFTDEADPQFKQVLKDCNVKIIYALSPQAKGKVERPYQWLQDRIVRTCAKDKITNIKEIKKILKKLVYKYNYQWVHSTTREIPAIRLERAIRESKTMFRPFKIKEPFQSSKDIFCLRDERRVNSYHKISINTLELKVPNVPPREKVELRVVPDYKTGIAEIRMWFKNNLVSVQKVRHTDLKL